MNAVVSGDAARLVISVLVFVVIALLAWAVLSSRRRSGVGAALAPYTLEASPPKAETRHVTFAETTLARHGVEFTARVLQPSKLLPVLERALEQAAAPVRAAEALFFHVTVVTVVTLLGAAAGGAGGAIFALVTSVVAPVAVLRIAVARRRRAFQSQLPEALQLVASSLRSGRSLLQGLQALAYEVAEPMASELGRALGQVRLGRPAEDALDDMALRMGSEDARLAVSAVRMQRQIGGNLAELFSNVAATMVARDRLRGEVRALTAEGRMSAIVIGGLPIALGMMMYAIDPDYVSVLFHDPLGQSMLAGAAGLAVGGVVWMKKTMAVEI